MSPAKRISTANQFNAAFQLETIDFFVNEFHGSLEKETVPLFGPMIGTHGEF